MNRTVTTLAVLSVVLAACGGTTPPAPTPPGPTTLFTPENVYGASPIGGAREVSPDEFQRLVASGDVRLVTPRQEREARENRERQAARDRAFLESLPNKSEALKDLLGAKRDVTPTEDGDFAFKIRDNDGAERTVRLLSDAAALRAAVLAYEAARDPANLLSVYTLAFEPLGDDAKAKLPDPEALAGRPLAAVQAALADLERFLETRESAVQAAGTVGDAFLGAQRIDLPDRGSNAGNGSDGAPCDSSPRASRGLWSRFDWPLKFFLTDVRDQANRGTCWAFTAIGALESRDLVVGNTRKNYSEQYMVSVHQNRAFLDNVFDYGEGDWTNNALDTFASRPLAPENAWTYNPAMNRGESGYGGVCDGYTGFCSESRSQSPTVCARLRADLFCGFEEMNYVGPETARADRSRVVWSNDVFGGSLPLATIRSLLDGGQTLQVSFGVHPGFDDPNAGSAEFRGYVTDFTDRSRGGHAALIVGFVPDALASGVAPTLPGGTGGGWFVLRNSWGCGVADKGYYYVPVRYVQRFFNEIRALDMTSRRSAAFTETVTLLRRGGLTLRTTDGATAPLNRDKSVTAVLPGVSPSLYTLRWTPAPRAITGNTAIYRFGSVGPQTVTAIAERDGREVQRASIVLNVVNTAPTAIIETPSLGATLFRGQSVPFGGYGLDPNEGPGPSDGRLATCTWSSSRAGDFTSLTGCAPSFTFTSVGARTLTLTVRDSQGLTGSASVNVSVIEPPANLPPRAAITVTPAPTFEGAYDYNTRLTLASTPSDAENDTPFSFAWSARKLLNDGTPWGDTLTLGAAQNVTWKPRDTSSFFFPPTFPAGNTGCAHTNGQRVLLTLRVTDRAGSVGVATREVRVVCPPE